MVKIEDFSNNINDVDDNTGLLATLMEKPKALAQDSDYIYAQVKVKITDTATNAKFTGGTTTSAAATIGSIDANGDGVADNVSIRTYIQKISKAQGDKKDDSYLPKTVQSYEVTKGEFNCSDADDAYTAINDSDTTFTVVENQLLAIKNTGSNVKVTTINLKRDKVKFNNTTLMGTDKLDVYLAEKDDADDVDTDDVKAVDIDVHGNVWTVTDGKIYKFKNNNFTKVYTCDSSLNSISVYDENNLIAWEYDGNIYTTVNEIKNETKDEVPLIKTGWVNTTTGSTFYDITGKQVVNSWINIGGVWYMIKANGIMAIGWYNDTGTWYYLNASGAMQTGWLNDNGTWYYLQSSGAMKTGWLNDNGTWYYLQSSGAMAANTKIDGYKLAANGAWVS